MTLRESWRELHRWPVTRNWSLWFRLKLTFWGWTL